MVIERSCSGLPYGGLYLAPVLSLVGRGAADESVLMKGVYTGAEGAVLFAGFEFKGAPTAISQR